MENPEIMPDQSKIKITLLNIIINARDIRKSKPEAILMDIQMPGMSGDDAVRVIKENFPEIKILMQTIFEGDNKKSASACNGTKGSTHHNVASVGTTETVAADSASMSPGIASQVLKIFQSKGSPVNDQHERLSLREKEILSCLAEGMSYKMIADYCFISIDTVSGHMRHIYKKLQVHSKGEAVAKAIRGRIV